jgi:hypothetical protein
MRWLLILVLLAGLGAGIYFLAFGKESEAFVTYKQFADAKTELKWKPASDLIGGDEAKAALEREQNMWNTVGASMRGTILGTSYSLESETASADGNEVKLKLTQQVRLNPPGQTSAFGRTVPHRHTATMKKISGSWKVMAYSDDVIEGK